MVIYACFWWKNPAQNASVHLELHLFDAVVFEYHPDSSDQSVLEADSQRESEKVSRSPSAEFLPGKIRFLEADGSEKAAGSHEPRLSPLLNRRHLVDGMRSGAAASSKFTSAHSAAIEEINK